MYARDFSRCEGKHCAHPLGGQILALMMVKMVENVHFDGTVCVCALATETMNDFSLTQTVTMSQRQAGNAYDDDDATGRYLNGWRLLNGSALCVVLGIIRLQGILACERFFTLCLV